MARLLEEALDAGAFGLSSGPDLRPRDPRRARARWPRWSGVAARRGALYATHMRNESAGLFESLEEALATAGLAGPGARLQVSHLKAGARAVWGRAGEAVARPGAGPRGRPRRRRRPVPVHRGRDDPPVRPAAGAPGPAGGRDRRRPARLGGPPPDQGRDRRRDLGLGERGRDPGWDGIVLAGSHAHAGWAGRSFADLGRDLGLDPADVACDILAADRLDSWITIHCMDEADVETILGVPWIAVCTDAEGRRPGHPVLDAGVPHPRTYGSAPRVLGRYVRERGVLPLETAVAKLTSVPAARLGLRDRGVVREGAFADLVVFDPATVADRATYERPAVYPDGIDVVIVNGVVAVRDGVETGARPGRLLRRP